MLIEMSQVTRDSSGALHVSRRSRARKLRAGLPQNQAVQTSPYITRAIPHYNLLSEHRANVIGKQQLADYQAPRYGPGLG